MTEQPTPARDERNQAAGGPRLLTYAAPNVVRPLSRAEVIAWRVTRRVVVVAVAMGVAMYVSAGDGWWKTGRLLFGSAIGLLLGLCIPMTRVNEGAARSQVRREIQTMLWLLAVIAVLAAVAAVFTALVVAAGPKRG